MESRIQKEGATLLVLAAGMGARFGGLKQMEGVGPKGEVLLEYSVFDAFRHRGFTNFVFVIRREIEADFVSCVLSRFPSDFPYTLVYQEVDMLPSGAVCPAGRSKPWGTAHAVWCARDAIRGPFAVINADDFYGRDAFDSLGRFLGESHSRGEWCMVGYELPHTLSEQGYVSRGVCSMDAEGNLLSLEECTRIQRLEGVIVDSREDGVVKELGEDTVVSMNCWGFTLDFMEFLDDYIGRFFSGVGGDLKAECYLPTAVCEALQTGRARCAVIPTVGHWYGVTYYEDRSVVKTALGAKHAEGEYPEALWAR